MCLSVLSEGERRYFASICALTRRGSYTTRISRDYDDYGISRRRDVSAAVVRDHLHHNIESNINV